MCMQVERGHGPNRIVTYVYYVVRRSHKDDGLRSGRRLVGMDGREASFGVWQFRYGGGCLDH